MEQTQTLKVKGGVIELSICRVSENCAISMALNPSAVGQEASCSGILPETTPLSLAHYAISNTFAGMLSPGEEVRLVNTIVRMYIYFLEGEVAYLGHNSDNCGTNDSRVCQIIDELNDLSPRN
jgi:hypothetical protein